MISFTVEVKYFQEPQYIFDSFLQIEKWNDFKGFGIIPGIKTANFIIKTDSIKGTIIWVKNSDGSSHKEEILAFEKDTYLKIKMYDFSKPLSYFASFFIEEWALKKIEDGELNQHEGSYLVGKYLKEMYIDSALKTREKIEAKEKNKKVPKKPVTNVVKNISYKDFKVLNKLN